MGGGDNFKILWGGHSYYEGDIKLMGRSPSPPLGKTLDVALNIVCN